MRRTLFVLILGLVAVSTSASYKIYLVSGETIVADEKPLVKDGAATFIKSGITFSIPASRIDFEKSERNALAEAAAPKFEQIVTTAKPAAKPTQAAPPVKVTDESLEKIRQRSRLANEGEFAAPEAGATPAPAGAAKDAEPAGKASNDLQERVRQAEQNVAAAEAQRNEARSTAATLKSMYDASINQEQRTNLWAQYESSREALTAADARVDAANADLSSANRDLSRSPVVVELPATEGK